MTRHYVIVGSGIAGLSAAETLRQRDPASAISLVGEERHGFYSRPGLAYLLTGTVPEKQLFVRNRADLRELNLDWIHSRVTRILPDAHQIVLSTGQSLAYDRLLLATGSMALAPSFPGGNLAGVVKLDNLDDARHLLKLARPGRTAVVVGGGITALELAEGMRAHGTRVHYLLRGDRYWSNVLDETESRIVKDRLQAEGVALHYHTEIKAAWGRRDALAGVETVAGERLQCDILVVAIGVLPRVELARQAGLSLDRGILVDETMQTSAPDVYAAGDVAQVRDPRSGRAVLDTLWSAALAEGETAGANMAGGHVPYLKSVALNVTQLAGLTTAIMGAVGSGRGEDLLAIARGDSEAWGILPGTWSVAHGHGVNRVRLLVGERTLTGALVMGDQSLARPLYRLISEQVDISPIRSGLEASRGDLPSLISTFYQNWGCNHVTPPV